MTHYFGTRILRVALLAAFVLGASSLAAVPLAMKYQVKDLGGGQFQYDFMLEVDNNDNTYVPGQGWRWLIFGDSATSSPLTAWTISPGQLPVGPWTGMSSSSGGHNGPNFSSVQNYWIPTGLGDCLHWRGTSTANLAQGQMLWSTLNGTLNGGVAANFTIATRLDPGITVEATKGTAASVLNNETGGGNGYQAGTFKILNNGAASDTVTSITIAGFGTGNHTAAYTSFEIYRDQTASGTVGSYDTGDVLIGGGAFAGSPATVTIPVPAGEENFAVAASKQYFIVVKLNGTAATADTFKYRVSDVSAGVQANVFNAPSHLMEGLVIIGPEVTFDGKVVGSVGVTVSGTPDHEIQAFTLGAAPFASQQINSITVDLTGTITDVEITAAKLWEDTNANGALDAAEPQVGTTQIFTAGSLTFSGAPLINLNAGQSKSYVLTYSLATGITNGTTFGATLAPVTDVVAVPGPVRVVTPLIATSHMVYLVNIFPYLESFDAFPYTDTNASTPKPLIAGWANEVADGGLDWIPDYGGTPSAVGPTTDHTTGGATSASKYLYVEDSTLSSSNDPMNLLTPPIDITALAQPKAEFWLYSNNNANPAYENTLHYDLIDASTGAISLDFVPFFKGALNVWTKQTIDLSAVTANVIQIRFRVEGTGTSFYNDLAMDDFGVSDSPEMNVKNNATAASVPDGGSDAIGGVMTTGQNFTWDIENLASVSLNLTGTPLVAVAPVSNVSVIVTTNPTTPVAGAGTTSFVINVAPLAAGAFSFTVSIANDDPNENPYNFTVSGTGVANQPPAVSIPAGSNWVNNAGNYELTVNPGAAYNDSLELNDPTPDNMTVTVIPPGTVPTTSTSAPASIGTPTAGPITLNWAGTADASNPPGTYTWQLSVSDGISIVNFTASIIIANLPPTHTIGVDAGSGDGLASGTAYTGQALVGSTTGLVLADISDPNTSQTPSFVSSTPDAGNPAGGSGFNVALVAGSITATPAAALQLADVGTHIFTVVVTDGTNNTTVYVAAQVVTPEIDVSNATPTAIPDGGADTITGATAGVQVVVTYTIANNGGADLSVTGVVISNTVNCTANVTANPVSPVAPSGSTTFDVSVTPGPGAFSFDIDINSDDVDENPYDIAVSGMAAAAPEIDVSNATPMAIADGGSDNLGTRNTGQLTNVVYTITNLGTSNLTITGVSTSGDVNCTSSVTVNPAATIAPSTSTTFTVGVTPTADGAFSFNITIASDDADENPYDISVSGTAAVGGVSGGGGGGGGGGCAAGESSLPLFALLAMALISLVAIRRRRA